MVRPDWRQRLEFASVATLGELIDAKARVTCVLEGDLGRISTADRKTLVTWGLPAIEGCFYPSVIGAQQRTEGMVFQLGSFDSPLPDGAEHLFVAEIATGEVVKVPRADGAYRVHVNSSLGRFVEAAWRFYYAMPVLYQMAYSGTDEVPFAYEEERSAVRNAAWAIAVKADPALEEHGDDTFWWGMSWEHI